MKFLCSRQKLNEAVLNVQRTVSSKSSIPALEGILLTAEEDHIRLCGYDLEIGMTTEIPATVQEPGSIVMSAKLFGDIIRRFPDDNVRFQSDDKLVSTIESGESKFSIAGIPAQEYPELPSVGEGKSMQIPASVLKSMIRQTLFAVAQNDAKPIHTGTLFELSEGKIRMVSVDGYRMAIREEAVANTEKNRFVVPGKTLTELLKLLGDGDDDVEIVAGMRHILFRTGGYTVISRLLEGEFLDYRAALPKENKMEARISTQEFTASLERVSLLITERLRSPVRCRFGEDGIRLSCSTAMGRANDRVAAKVQGGELEIGFNSRYLLDALHNAECDEVRVLLNGPLSPMEILPCEGNSFLFLVLPVRLKSGVE
ncbi:MAG: DNA polymerase III subunit beta [Oscillospiraceae bacterium]|jgi:DNA polymerase-3 subunit beta|nr:DNA polymerase III subunit beta [Oscillospiraceae bacterium]